MVSSAAGIIMGWLYIRYGLIAAVVAHFIVDLVVYVIPRLLGIIV
jgi:membrane protease YdiL (CAAX protease family)